MLRFLILLFVPSIVMAQGAKEPSAAEQAKHLAAQDTTVFGNSPIKQAEIAAMMSSQFRTRRFVVNDREQRAWDNVKTRADWEKFRDERITALRKSLGEFPPVPKEVKVHTSATREGKGYRVHNILYESRSGFWVTANLYVPEKPVARMPGIVIIHSHHNPKTEGELQDMGATWANAGCVVLVPDQLGHGERRQHPFINDQSYSEMYRVSRQDYYFRFNSGAQLSILGESLIGWMVWDIMRGVDVLLARPDIDKEKIILLGSVAGGGDPAAVTAALDPRIKAVVPYNFGKPSSETRNLAKDPNAKFFNFMGGGSWESTRNLPLSGRDGFMPWVLVAAAAPRGLVYAHEFAWDRERDPTWTRLQKIWSLYDASDKLAFAYGSGSVSGKAPESTHCNNIGQVHRKMIHPAFEKWFGIKVEEQRDRHTADDLRCLTDETMNKLKPKKLTDLAQEKATQQLREVNAELDKLHRADQELVLPKKWTAALGIGDIPKREVSRYRSANFGSYTLDRMVITTDPGVHVPFLLLTPKKKEDNECFPIVICVCADGKDRFVKERADAITHLLRNRIAVCIPDLRGCGESKSGEGRGRNSAATSNSATEQMLGTTLLGQRIRDLSMIFGYIVGDRHQDYYCTKVSIWGESFAPVNAADRNLAVPYDVDKFPTIADPTGALVAAFGAMYHHPIHAVVARGGLVNYRSLLDSPFIYVPHDAIAPGAIKTGDLERVYGFKPSRPMLLEGFVDGRNRRVTGKQLESAMKPIRNAYVEVPALLTIHEEPRSPLAVAEWFVKVLK